VVGWDRRVHNRQHHGEHTAHCPLSSLRERCMNDANAPRAARTCHSLPPSIVPLVRQCLFHSCLLCMMMRPHHVHNSASFIRCFSAVFLVRQCMFTLERTCARAVSQHTLAHCPFTRCPLVLPRGRERNRADSPWPSLAHSTHCLARLPSSTTPQDFVAFDRTRSLNPLPRSLAIIDHPTGLCGV
jgi:hypothetical protein